MQCVNGHLKHMIDFTKDYTGYPKKNKTRINNFLLRDAYET